MMNLDELEELERKATKGPWHDASGKGSAVVSAPGENCAVYLNVRAVELDETVARWQADAALIVALRNEAVPMIRELRELREENARAIAWLDRMSWANATIDTKTTSKGPLEIQLADALAERDALRAEVEKVKKERDFIMANTNAALATVREDALEEAALELEGPHRKDGGNCEDRHRALLNESSMTPQDSYGSTCGNCSRADRIRALKKTTKGGGA